MERASQKKEISFKGRGTSVCVAFEGAILPGIPDVLRELRDAGGMVTGHQIVFDFKKLQVPRNWLLDLLRDVIFPMNLSVSLWSAEEPSTKENLASLGFKVDGSERPMVTQGTLKIVSIPLRGGQALQHDGDVLMLGDLHHGAEINATGSIIVLGAIQGQVHAGCNGDNSASVITLSYRTNQLRIGSMISNAMEPGASPWWGRPVRIVVEGGVFVASDISWEK